MLIKEFVVDSITVTELDNIEVRKVLRVLEDGVVLGKSYSRHVVEPGQDYSQEDSRVRAIAALIHTPQAIAAATLRRQQLRDKETP